LDVAGVERVLRTRRGVGQLPLVLRAEDGGVKTHLVAEDPRDAEEEVGGQAQSERLVGLDDLLAVVGEEERKRGTRRTRSALAHPVAHAMQLGGERGRTTP